MTMPNFLIIGAGKAGTSSLYDYLGQHPKVYVSPVKETNFFALDGSPAKYKSPEADSRINSWSVWRVSDYRALFDNVQDETAVGEASPLYLYSPIAAQQIHKSLPNVKLIAVLRNPVERAYSSYSHLRKNGREPITSFDKALEAEHERISQNWEWIWHYQSLGFYYTQLKRYFDNFDSSQIRVYLFDDFKSEPGFVIGDIFRFLGVDDDFLPNMSHKQHVSGIPRNALVHSLLTTQNPIKSAFKRVLPQNLRRSIYSRLETGNLERRPMDPATHEKLILDYHDDVTDLQALINRNLSHWLKPSTKIQGEFYEPFPS